MTQTKRPEIKWETDDDDFGVTKPAADEGSEEFANLLKTTHSRPQPLLVGEKVKGIVVMIPVTTGDVMIELGGKSSGLIEKQELVDEHGVLKVKVGDAVEAYVISKKGGEILLSYKMSQQLRSAEDLEMAKAKGFPVRGKVLKAVKGGFEVAVLGKTAFCPISQIDLRFTEQGAEYVGKELEFLVEKVEEKGRNIVLSRAALLRSQAEAKAKELIATLTPDTVLTGTVSEVRDFGAFVDIGGVEGLVHISELSYARVAKPQEVVTRGDKVRVKVLKIDKDDKGRPKIGLSMKAALQDPWADIHQHVEGGKNYHARVVNLMPFGAFVEIVPGVEGLLHVSELSWTKRVHHPSEVLKIGDTVTVTIKDIDTAKKRIALTMKQIEDDPWFEASSRFPPGKVVKGPVERLKPFGAIVEIAPGLSGLLPLAVLKRKYGEAYKQPATPGKELEVRIVTLDLRERKVLLTLADIEEEDSDRRHYLEYLKAEEEQKPEPAATGLDRPGSFGALLSAKLGQKR